MSSEMNLENKPPKKSRKKLFFGVIIVIAAGIGITLLTKHSNEDKHSEKNVQNLIPEVTTSTTLTPHQKTYTDEEIKQFIEFLVDYNNVLDEYLEKTQNFNNLIGIMGTYDFLKLPDAYPQYERLDEQFDPLVYQNKGELEKRRGEMVANTATAEDNYGLLCVNIYNCLVDEYNAVADEYEKLTEVSAVDYVKDLLVKVERKGQITEPTEEMKKGAMFAQSEFDKVLKETDNLVIDYSVVIQITNPDSQWVMDRIKGIQEITGCQAVSVNNDPNQMLGKEGGYTSCIYFSDSNIDQHSIPGDDIIAKGTDCGGAIEVYENKAYALNRCEYLSQFDGTLLYSGSYAIVGTMVIRTSYKLNSQGQVTLTDLIVKELTRLEP